MGLLPIASHKPLSLPPSLASCSTNQACGEEHGRHTCNSRLCAALKKGNLSYSQLETTGPLSACLLRAFFFTWPVIQHGEDMV